MIEVVHQRDINSYLEKSRKNKPEEWVYLASDYFKYKELKALMDSKPIDLNKIFQEISYQLKDAINEAIAQISLQYNELEWWVTNLSERSPYNSVAIKNIVLLFVFDHLFKNFNKDILCIVDSDGLCEAINQNYKRSIELYSSPYSLIDRIKIMKNIAKNKTNYFFHHSPLTTHHSPLPIPQSPITLIHTWVTANIALKKDPLNFYFDGLPDFLKKNGEDVWYLVNFLDKANHQKIKSKLLSLSEKIIFLEDWQTKGDIFSAGIRPLFKRYILREIYIDNKDITPILSEDLIYNLHCNRDSQSLSYYYLFKNLSKKGIRIKKFIYTFENQTLEKSFTIAIRKFFPKVKIIAFQHTGIPNFLLSYIPPKCELEVLPTPHKIICNGRVNFGTIKRHWNKASEIVEGCALRHTHLFKNPNPQLPTPNSSHNIGVAMPVEFDVTLELTDVLTEVAKKNSSFKFLIKLHPAIDKTCYLERTTDDFKNSFSAFEIFEGEITDFFSKINILIFTVTDLALQAVISEIPMICYVPHMKLDMNFIPEELVMAKVFDAKTLKKAILEVFNKRTEISNKFELRHFYNNVEEKYLREFL